LESEHTPEVRREILEEGLLRRANIAAYCSQAELAKQLIRNVSGSFHGFFLFKRFHEQRLPEDLPTGAGEFAHFRFQLRRRRTASRTGLIDGRRDLVRPRP
jgi:hypothetical protein